ncbi:MAG: iron-containing alcohol dehydrogenase [Chloroflexi bacterium]|nr:iron-containing alcohol dehydrogenase [Chloroflexota bacterium]
MSMDAAKYVAWRRSLPLLLAPSIVSVDAVVTNTIAVRRDGSVVYEGFVVADRIVADLDLIAAAPARFNRAGAGDLLSIHTGRRDWKLGARAGRIAFDEDLDRRAGVVLDVILGLGDEIGQVTDRALEAILRAYAEVNAILLEVGHAGPEEGSEHYFAYHAEAVAGRSFVHGELLSLGTLIMATLQDHEPTRIRGFLEDSRVAWQPAHLGLDRDMLGTILEGLPAFVRQAGLPYSIIDEADLGPAAVEALLEVVTG